MAYTEIESTVHYPSKIVHDVNIGEHNSDFKISKFYINNTSLDLIVIHRNNLPVETKKATNFYATSGVFRIRTVYHFNTRLQIINAINYAQKFKVTNFLQEDELDLVKDALLHAYDNNNNISKVQVTIDKEIPEIALQKNPSVFVADADVLVCDVNKSATITHPFSKQGMADSQYKTLAKDNRTSGVFIEIIDNQIITKSRFMYAAKQVIEVKAKHDVNRKSGVYLTVLQCQNNEDPTVNCKFYTFEEAEKELALFKTQEETVTHGNPELLNKTTNDELQLQLTENNRQLEILRLENLRIKEEAEIRKTQRVDKVEEKKVVRDDYYETRSYQRKDNSEALKMFGVAVATGLAVAALMNKKK